MTMNFGQLSFMRGNQPVIGLPLDVIDKVGTQLTEKYYRNRSAASAMKKQVLDLPDSNSDVNKKIIEGKSEELKKIFEPFKDKWDEADDAVYDIADSIVSDPDIKDLYKYNAQYQKVDEQIEKSGAPEYYKNIRRAYNQAINKGIKDDQGNRLSYQGKGLSGNLDITENLERVNKLVDGWKMDIHTRQINPSQFEGMETSDGYKIVMNAFGKEKVSTIDEKEVRQLVMSTVLNDPDFNAKVNDIAELNLFAQTGKVNPSAEDVTKLMVDRASFDPNTMNTIIARSPEFVAKMESLKTNKDKQNYFNTILSNENLRNQHIVAGIDNLNRSMKNLYQNDDLAYKQAYTYITKLNQLSSFEGLIDKTVREEIDTDMHYSESSLNGEMYKKYAEFATRTPASTPGGQINSVNLSKHLDTRQELLDQLVGFQLQKSNLLANNTGSKNDAAIKQLDSKINMLESQKATSDLYVEEIKKQLGVTDKDLMDASKKEIIGIISFLNTKYPDEDPNDKTPLFRSLSNKKSYHPMSNTKAEDIYNILQNNINDETKAMSEITSKYPDIPRNGFKDLFKTTNKLVKENTQKILSKSDTQFSSPYEYISYRGGDNKAISDLTSQYKESYLRNDGLWHIVETNSEDRKPGTTNMGDGSMFTHTKITGKNTFFEPNQVTMKPVMFKNSTGKPAFEVTITNPALDNPIREIVEFTGASTKESNDLYYELAKDASLSYVDKRNPFQTSSLFDAKRFIAYPMTMLPISKINGKDANDGTTVANILSNTTPNNDGMFPVMTVDFNGAPITLVSKNINGTVVSRLYNGAISVNNNSFPTLPYIETVDNGSSPIDVLEKFSARIAMQDAMRKGDMKGASAIYNTFNLK